MKSAASSQVSAMAGLRSAALMAGSTADLVQYRMEHENGEVETDCELYAGDLIMVVGFVGRRFMDIGTYAQETAAR